MNTEIFRLLVFSLVGMASLPAQLDEFCIVQDKDGWSNVREKEDIKSKVIARVDHGQLVWVAVEGKTKWPEIIFVDKKGKEQMGFIHASRLKTLSDFKQFKTRVSEKDQKETLENKDLKVEIALKKFNPENHKLSYEEVEGGRFLSKIDGQPFWGTDGGVPSTQYQKITVQKNGKTMTVPAEAFKNLFQPGLYPGNTTITINPKDETIYITSFNSDGAGGYVVGFVFKKGSSGNLVRDFGAEVELTAAK